MKSTTAPAKKDFVIISGCVALLLVNLGAIGTRGRGRAKEAVCLSNLRQWGTVFAVDVQENNGYFYSGQGPLGQWWITDLDEADRDFRRMKIWLCPEATVPLYDEYGNATGGSNTFSAWGILYGANFGPNGIAGSYGMNGHALNVPDEDNWKTLDVQGAENIPLFVDALRLDMWPDYFDAPPPIEDAAWSSNNMARCCINRHNGAVNGLFMDWSARKIGLKELWALKWHRNFNTAGPWTNAGGVTWADWPRWMWSFKEY